ncbi:MAG: TraR/DksA family transcriptional regulator [Gammaproteobacteria bacterium]|nr:TraR/DksA family transcriptional regulator [Gammaproteobacteria bacterium]
MSNKELNAVELQLLNELLKAQKQTLEHQLQQVEANTQPVALDQQSVGRVSRIDAIQQQQMAIANRQQLMQQSHAVNTSLSRIGDDEYGFCLECAEPIGFARLQVQPYAPYCLACQSNKER